ncbi:MAG: polyprenyl synthetase family protein [Erysipelotrichales bacterium]
MSINLYEEFPQLEKSLKKVNNVIQKSLESSEESFSTIIQKRFNENSKLIRPALCLIASEYNPKVKEKAINLAAAIEMMHVASLVHDDIIDQAKTRRNEPTINEEYDVGYAVICGDYLFSKSFQLIFETQDLRGISKMGSNVTTMVFGEVEQYLEKYDENISIERYFSIIEKKTASFFATSLVMGAYLANVKEKEIKILEQIGRTMGMLFQIQDDLLDFESQEQIGKSSQSDILRGTYSLPIIIALEDSIKFRDYVMSNKEEISFNQVMTYLDSSDALQKTQNYIDEYYNKTISLINELSNKEVNVKLTTLVNKLMKRSR